MSQPQPRLTDAEFLALNTVRIEAHLLDGNKAVGTGFLYEFLSTDEIPLPALVTNKHVLEGAETVILTFNPRSEAGNNVDFKAEKPTFEIKEFENGWYEHPNPDIDLAFIPLGVILNRFADAGKPAFTPFFRRENLPKAEEWNALNALEQVVFIGYPDGIWDSVNNLPVLRRGITATHPKMDFKGKPEFLIDAAVFTGSSGSPVFLYEYKTMMLGQDLNLGKDKPRLVGILYAGFQHREEGTMESIPIPTLKKRLPVMLIPNNLGIVIKSTELDGFIPLIDKRNAEHRHAELQRKDAEKTSSQEK